MSEAPTFCFFAAPPHGGGVVMEVSPPDAHGRIAFREWETHAGESTATHGHLTAAELERRMRAWTHEGWTLGDSPERVLGWLKSQSPRH